jgi:tetratricopeptide (TPR) repeat protein
MPSNISLQAVWASHNLTENFDSERQQLPQFASASSRQEWQEAAEKYFDNENYCEAAVAFRRAGLSQQENVAQAYQRRKEAELTVSKPERRKQFKVAAKLFLQCAEAALEDSDQKAFLGIAALCWSQVEDWIKAAEAYQAAENYDEALQMYRKGGNFDEAVQMVKYHKNEIKDKAILNAFIHVARVFYLKDQELRQVPVISELLIVPG